MTCANNYLLVTWADGVVVGQRLHLAAQLSIANCLNTGIMHTSVPRGSHWSGWRSTQDDTGVVDAWRPVEKRTKLNPE